MDKLTRGNCVPVEQVIPSAKLTWNNSEQKAGLCRTPAGSRENGARYRAAIALAGWQFMAFIGYNASAYQSSSGGETFNSQYLSPEQRT